MGLILLLIAALPAVAFSMDIRINAGGGDYTDNAGNLWSADSGYNTGEAFSRLNSIAYTSDDSLYQSERWDDISRPELEYSFDVANGDYTVHLHFSDRYSETGKRIFDVEIEGQLVLDNLDIYSEAGSYTTLVKSFPVTVYDEQLSIRFLHGIQNPKINAIEILKQSSAAALPSPTGLCISTYASRECAPMLQQPLALSAPPAAPTRQTGIFPGTNLKFYPGFVVASSENESVSAIESRWQQLFKGNRKETYRPPGVYGGVTRRLDWYRYYVNQYIRPTDPRDHTDPAYDWSLLDAVFKLNCVQNEGALVVIAVGEVGYSGKSDAPAWLSNSTYDGTFNSGIDGGSGKARITPKYYKYTGPDIRGKTNVGGARRPIVDESLYFYQAMHDHLVATGNIDKVMFLTMSEYYVKGNADLPPDYNATDFSHGIGTRSRSIASIWAESQICVQMSSLTGSRRDILWRYMDAPLMGITFPDMKLSGTNIITASSARFSHPDGTDQKDIRLLSQATEGNGQRLTTYFAPGIPNPWGYSDVTKPQTASHILWALSGRPKGVNKDSGLGQAGDDPSGIMPVHTMFVDWGRSWQKNSPSIGEWLEAIDTFGPPGTKAFPYLPPGYKP
jgi:hypothetical protein